MLQHAHLLPRYIVSLLVIYVLPIVLMDFTLTMLLVPALAAVLTELTQITLLIDACLLVRASL